MAGSRHPAALAPWSCQRCCCRDRRPAKIAVIMRGLPGSGKTFIAKALRELEVGHGGEAPRIHALDDYFVTVSPSLLSAVKRRAKLQIHCAPAAMTSNDA